MIPDKSTIKWYNDKFKLGLSILFWPLLVYGIYKTDLIKKATKQIIAGICILLVIFAALGKHSDDKFLDKFYVRITNYKEWPEKSDVGCYVVIPKDNPSYCFHILVFLPNPELAKTLGRDELNHMEFCLIPGLNGNLINGEKEGQVGADGKVIYQQKDEIDIINTIRRGYNNKIWWEPTSLYYYVKDGELYEKSTDLKLNDYYDKNEKIPELLNNTQNTSSNSNDIQEPQNSQAQNAPEASANGKPSSHSESSEDGINKHDLSSIPGCYVLRYNNNSLVAKTILYLLKDGKAKYLIHGNSSTDIRMLNGTYEVNGNDIFVVHQIGSFHVHKQLDGSLRTEDGLIYEQSYSY